MSHNRLDLQITHKSEILEKQLYANDSFVNYHLIPLIPSTILLKSTSIGFR